MSATHNYRRRQHPHSCFISTTTSTTSERRQQQQQRQRRPSSSPSSYRVVGEGAPLSLGGMDDIDIDPLEAGPDPDAVLLEGEPETRRQQQEEEEYEAELAAAAASAASAKKVVYPVQYHVAWASSMHQRGAWYIWEQTQRTVAFPGLQRCCCSFSVATPVPTTLLCYDTRCVRCSSTFSILNLRLSASCFLFRCRLVAFSHFFLFFFYPDDNKYVAL